jgi:hypothetical protein
MVSSTKSFAAFNFKVQITFHKINIKLDTMKMVFEHDIKNKVFELFILYNFRAVKILSIKYNCIKFEMFLL